MTIVALPAEEVSWKEVLPPLVWSALPAWLMSNALPAVDPSLKVTKPPIPAAPELP